jgi:benzaldehyde dehydrogenase (NAD)
MKYERVSPITGLVVSSAEAMQVSDIGPIAERAQVAFSAWSIMGPNARRDVLLRVAESIATKESQLVQAMVDEIGATVGWAKFNVQRSIIQIREAASMTTQITGEIIPSDVPGTIAMATREPVGVMLGIAPWNAPIILGVRAIVMPLACGNSVIFKASEICPHTHALLIEAFNDAGFPEGTVNVVTNAPEDAGDVVGALIDHPAVRRINYTGSTNIGRIIAKRAAEHLKPCLLELGGKAPFLVLHDADLDEAVKAASFGAFFNQGQICMSTERVIVVESVYQAFEKKFADKVATMKAGDPRENKCALGAVVDMKTIVRVNDLIDDALTKGAKLLVGEKGTSITMDATVISGVTSDMKLYREESFGPITAIIKAIDEADAIRLANDTEYGLSSAVFTRDTARGLTIARQIRSGICHINGATVHDEFQMPFGGVGMSGYGRFGGKAAVDAFTELRWITIETQQRTYPI